MRCLLFASELNRFRGIGGEFGRCAVGHAPRSSQTNEKRPALRITGFKPHLKTGAFHD
jgi:hypothetical protein